MAGKCFEPVPIGAMSFCVRFQVHQAHTTRMKGPKHILDSCKPSTTGCDGTELRGHACKIIRLPVKPLSWMYALRILCHASVQRCWMQSCIWSSVAFYYTVLQNLRPYLVWM